MPEHKQYVNLNPKKPDELKEIKSERAGRVIKVKAKLNKKVEGVPIVFEIVSGKENLIPSLEESNFSKKQLAKMKKNMQGLAMPGMAKRRVVSDENGEAEIDFTLSSFGGDEFEVKAYVKKRGKKGKELQSDKYVVWRRIYYQVGRFKSGAVGANRKGSLPEIPNFDWSPVETEFQTRRHNIELVDDTRTSQVTRYKNILEPVKPYNDLKNSVKEGYVREREPVSLRVVLCNKIASPIEHTRKKLIILERKAIELKFNDITLWNDESMPIGTDCVISAHIQFAPHDTPRPISGMFIYCTGPSSLGVRFDLMEQSQFESSFGKKPSKAMLIFTLKCVKSGTNGLSWYNAVWLAHSVMHGKQTYSSGGKQSTAVHEIGHFVDMVSPGQKTWYVDKGHQGPHCSTGLSKADLKNKYYNGLNGTCVMFGEGDPFAVSANKFCKSCDPSVRGSSVRNPGRIRNWP